MPSIEAGALRSTNQELTMKFVARMFATMAFAFLLACPLRADDTPKPASTTKAATTTDKDGAVKSSVAPASAGEATPAAPAPMPAPKTGGHTGGADTPKIELFLGYSNLLATPMSLSNRIDDLQGGDTNIAFNFNRYLGLVGDFAGYHANTLTFNQVGGPSRDVGAGGTAFSYMGGPRLSYRRPHFTFFAQALFGDANARKVTINGCTGSPSCAPLPSENSFAMALGGGLDLNLTRHLAFRIIQAEYLMTRFMDPSSAAGTTGTRNNVRLSSGIVFRSGGNPPLPPTAACSIQPAEVFAGESVTASANGSNFNPKRTVTYSWNGTGVKVTGSEASAQIDTTGLQPGPYVVTANLSDGRKDGSATCSARFTVKEPRPPVISCSADPSGVQIGGTSTITSTASSPDGRRLIYSYSATSGNIAGTGPTAALSTQGAQPGRITVTCNANDDRVPPLTASSTTVVEVQAPPPPPPPAPEIKQLETKLALHSIYFQTARPTAEHPEGGLLDSQADILTALAADFINYLKYMPDAHLILSGHADPRGTPEYNKKLTERRVERAKSFLVEHGVPADHFELKAFGEENQLTADQIKQQMEENPDLSPEERQQMLKNLQTLVLANNRRVDITLSTTGQQSVRRYPFNAKDFLALISTKGGEKTPPQKKKP
jgi:outer membrane protein OmpA-like peptidoglycan-associated protein/opacity protein-like surface antigen